jgi:FtsP/CotA-like multicopper oxidase with cupredoxin domain
MSEHEKSRRGVLSVLALAAIAVLAPIAASAQSFIKCPVDGQELLKVPEITRDAATNKLQAVLKVSDQDRKVWFPALGPPDVCAVQHLRYFEGYSPVHPDETWPVVNGVSDPLPGPTLRARVGDVVEISFFNEIDLTNFPNSQYMDRESCDETAGIYPHGNGPINDTPPNCFHGSSTANVHFHGTHTNPNSTGDNVLLQIRPSPRENGKLVVGEDTVKADFTAFFKQCEENLVKVPGRWPMVWEQLPKDYRTLQHDVLTKMDANLKPEQKLWPPNQQAIDAMVWPQYYAGAYPICFQLPSMPTAHLPAIPPSPDAANPNILQMGQAPGTMWYHMHKHGSTTLNVNNTLIGAFIIEGQYDDDLKAFYKGDGTQKNWGLKQQVMVIQEVGVTPNMERGGTPKVPVDSFSVNGRRHPVVTMHPGEVQLWRIINGGARSGVYFVPPPPSATAVQWVQIAQDGVQFDGANYHPPEPADPPKSAGASKPFLMSAGNRVDLLVRVPKGATGTYNVQVYNVVQAIEVPTANAPKLKAIATLLTIKIVPDSSDPNPEMPFITATKFPQIPEFLKDIPESTINLRRTLTFNSTTPLTGANHTIDGHKFGDTIDQAMLLNTNEEWKIVNTTADALDTTKRAGPGAIMHPFHIHINPFQVVEVFNPWDTHYVFTAAESKPGTNCYIDPNNDSTWHPCDLTKISPPFVWWDVFGIPGGIKVPKTDGTLATIPGYFKMRSRFADYPGQYVLHCHILAHEDRGMMQLIEVVPNTMVLKHH